MDSLSLPTGSLVFLAAFFPDTPNKFAYPQIDRLRKIVIFLAGFFLTIFCFELKPILRRSNNIPFLRAICKDSA